MNFKGFDKKHKRFIEIDKFSELFLLKEKYTEDIEILLSTGKFDKNKKEIFQGDVVLFSQETSYDKNNYVGVIENNHEEYRSDVLYLVEKYKRAKHIFNPYLWLKEDYNEFVPIDWFHENDLEIVGNVYISPEWESEYNTR